jgi:hypothetical protein
VEQGGCLDSVETRPHGRSSEKERKRQRGGSLRTSSATGVRMVEMTDVLGLGFIPN